MQMAPRVRALCGAFCFIALAACSDSKQPAQPQAASEAASPGPTTSPDVPPIDACSLLTSDEIQSVQGEPVKETKGGGDTQGGLAVAQCYFVLPTFSNSISLLVVQKPTASGPQSPRDSWKQMFSPAKLKGVETADGKKKLPPLHVSDLGEEAYWTGNEAIGALHVLQGERYLTLSVGGGGGQALKIEKSTALARMILQRL
jgi:hypothetical protein